MQETTGDKTLSIRVAPEGFYVGGVFSACHPERMADTLKRQFDDADFVRAYVEIDTLSTVAVPESYCDNALAEGYLAVNNLLPAGHVPVQTQWNGVAIVMSCREDVVAWLRERYGTRVHFLSPLVCALDATGSHDALSLCLTATNVYIVLWNEGLKFAQALPCSSPTDLGYYISTLAAEYDLANIKIYVSGKYDKKLIRELKRFSPEISDANNKRKI